MNAHDEFDIDCWAIHFLYKSVHRYGKTRERRKPVKTAKYVYLNTDAAEIEILKPVIKNFQSIKFSK